MPALQKDEEILKRQTTTNNQSIWPRNGKLFEKSAVNLSPCFLFDKKQPIGFMNGKIFVYSIHLPWKSTIHVGIDIPFMHPMGQFFWFKADARTWSLLDWNAAWSWCRKESAWGDELPAPETNTASKIDGWKMIFPYISCLDGLYSGAMLVSWRVEVQKS